METAVLGTGSFSSRRAVVDPRSVRSSSSLSCDAASASYDGGAVTDSTRERTSATTLSCPDMCLMSAVNWAARSRWLNCRVERLSRFCWKACEVAATMISSPLKGPFVQPRLLCSSPAIAGRLAGLMSAGGVGSLECCPFDESGASFCDVSIAVTDCYRVGGPHLYTFAARRRADQLAMEPQL
jgi:hypothetical protein